MRKISYAVTSVFVLIILIINILSAYLPNWLIAHYDAGNAHLVVRYGLMERCERTVIDLPPGPSNRSHLEFADYECRSFPLSVQDKCDNENRLFCAVWSSARYFTDLGIGFSAMALVALFIGVSTHSRRRRVWRAVAGLVILHAVFQLVTFILITESYRKDHFPAFEHAKPGVGYVLNVVSWLSGFLVGIGVIVTGVAADQGHQWAAGNRPYRRIPSSP